MYYTKDKNFQESLKEFFEEIVCTPYFNGIEIVIANGIKDLAYYYDITLRPFMVEFDRNGKTLYVRKIIDE